MSSRVRGGLDGLRCVLAIAIEKSPGDLAYETECRSFFFFWKVLRRAPLRVSCTTREHKMRESSLVKEKKRRAVLSGTR